MFISKVFILLGFLVGVEIIIFFVFVVIWFEVLLKVVNNFVDLII